jgi:hypothetical protein
MAWFDSARKALDLPNQRQARLSEDHALLNLAVMLLRPDNGT